MIDIHSHILPGIDDGSPNIEETLHMMEMAYASGTRAIVATPHCNIPGLYSNYYGEWYDTLFDSTKEVIESNFGIEVYPGMEVYLTYDIEHLIDTGQVITINNSRYMLVEFGFGESEDYALQILQRVQSTGITPILAHVERFRFVRNHPDVIRRLRDMGIVIQVNKGSFAGHFGKKEQQTAFYLLNHKYIHVIASDAHSASYRTTYMKDVYEELKLECSLDCLYQLFEENPQRILNNKDII